MPLGMRVLPPPPPLCQEHVAKLAHLRSTDLSDVMGGSYTMTAQIAPVHRPIKRVVGSAYTICVPTNSEYLIKYAFNTARPGDVAIINAGGNMSSVLAGSNMVRGLRGRGAVAAIFDGIVRDIGEIKDDGLPVFARGIGTAEGPFGPDVGEVNVPTACGGTVVNPGDIVVADEDGIVVIPVQFVDEVAAAAEKLHARHESIQAGLLRGEQANIKQIEETLVGAGIEFQTR